MKEGNTHRARDYGIEVGVFKPGKYNAITDVKGVLVGHRTLIEGDDVRTGITVIMPHEGNLFKEKVPAAIYVGNGFGKLVGITQVNELGAIETPVVLTNTLSVWAVADALVDYTLSLPENKDVFSVNPVVGETNDSYLNNIQKKAIKKEHVFDAIKDAKSGLVQEGAIGAGTGTVCFGYKGGIGTSSRTLPKELGGYTIGVLVQTNYGGVLTINGKPVWKKLNDYPFKKYLSEHSSSNVQPALKMEAGSCMIVIATDAPLDSRNLMRLAKRSVLALSKTGSFISNGSGDYAIAFSTNNKLRIPHDATGLTEPASVLTNDAISPLFAAVVEATEEAIYNSLVAAVTTTGYSGHRVEALDMKKLME